MKAVERSEIILDGVTAKVRFWQQHLQTPITERQCGAINRILDEPGGFEGKLTTRKYASIAKNSLATAYRELDQLHQLGVLRRVGRGSFVCYELIYVREPAYIKP